MEENNWNGYNYGNADGNGYNYNNTPVKEKKSKTGLVIVIIIVVVILLVILGCCCCIGGVVGLQGADNILGGKVETTEELASLPDPVRPTQTPPARMTEPEIDSETESETETESESESESESLSEPEGESGSENETETGTEEESGSEITDPSGRSADEIYEELAMNFFRDYVSSNAITMHFRLKDPKKYGIEDDVPRTLGRFSVESFQEELKEEMDQLAELKAIDRNKLSEDNRISYDVLMYTLENDEDFDQIMAYLEPLSGVGGIHVNLGTTMASYRIDSKEDIEDYLEILGTADEYFSDVISFESYKMEQGTFMSAEQAKNVAQDCRDVITPEVKDSTFTTSFEERLNKVEGLSAEEKAAYIEKNQKIVKEEIYPAYQKLADYMDTMSGKATTGSLLADTEKGRKYYEYLVRCNVGTDRSVTDIQKLIIDRIDSDNKEIYNYYTAAVQQDMLNLQYDLNDPLEIIEDLKQKMKTDFPDGDSLAYEVKEIPEDMRSTSAPAYYIVSPIDSADEDVDSIFYNPNQSGGSDMYHTLAHEGFPGHLFQTNYFRQHCDDPLRQILRYDGYVEGYATYVEMQSYRWVDGPLDDTNELLRLNASVTEGIYALLDVQINYFGWDRERTRNFVINMFGDSAGSSSDSIYDLVIEEPGNYLNYYVGYLEIEAIRDEYLKKGHTAKEFNTALLEMGPAPFPVIRKQLLGK